jgi:GT2 family glycosyltransferase
MVERNLVGVVTVTFNSASVLPGFLKCTLEQKHDAFLLYAVDNASKDDTLVMLRECWDHRLKIIANSDNKGVAEGNNQGIRAALADGCSFVLLINNDTEFDPLLLTTLLDGLAKHDADMTCPKIMYFDEPQRIWAAGGAFQRWLGYRNIHLGADEVDNGQYDLDASIDYVPTCCVLVKRSVFETVGLMSSEFFVYMDDVDFMYRAKIAGVRLVYIPSARLLHKVGRLTGGPESPFTVRYCTRNRVYFLLRHFGLLRSLPMLLMMQAYYIVGLIIGRYSFGVYMLKQKATIEGSRMWTQKRWLRAPSCQP